MPATPWYWDVEPKRVVQSVNPEGVCLPITIHGNPRGTPVFQSVDESIATVENGWIFLGQKAGATMILVSDNRAGDSMRYIQVEVTKPGVDDTYDPGDFPPDWGY